MLAAMQGGALNPLRADLINQTMAGNFLPGQAGGNPFLDAVIRTAQAPTAEALEHALGRTIPGQFLAAGHVPTGNSALNLATARALEAGGRSLGDIATNIGGQAYQFERGLQNAAVGLSQQDIQAMTGNLQAQGLPRLLAQNDITSAISLGQQGIGNWLQGLQIAGAYPLQTVANQTQMTGTTSPNMMAGLFGNKGLFPWAFPTVGPATGGA